MSFYGWKPYVPVATRRRQAEKAAAQAKKVGAGYTAVAPSSGAIAKTFWGKAWCQNLEGYSDFANRLPRGRTYVRNGSVIHLGIGAGKIEAKVMGSSLYDVVVKVAAVPEKQWQAIGAECSTSIDSLVELLQGKLSKAVMEHICTPRTGLFPAPGEISFSCSCPDWASMCKHVAAVLYGVGARLDQQPELLFLLRKVDAKDLVSQAGAGLPQAKKGPAAGKLLDSSSLADLFGIEMDEGAAPKKPAVKPVAPSKAGAQMAAERQKPVVKEAAKKTVKKTAKAATATTTSKPASVRKATVVEPPPAKKPARKPVAKAKVVAAATVKKASVKAVSASVRTKKVKAG
jgi:uncharacterized Zn finger protein